MLKNEAVNENYAALYCEVPRHFLADIDTLRDSAAQLHCESKDNLFNEHIDSIVRAAATGNDFPAANEFHKVMAA